MKRKIITIISIVCIVALCIGAAVANSLSNRITLNAEGTVGNTAGNLFNGGIFCEDDGYVYFSNPYDSNALYRMNPDETDMVKLVATETGSINAAGDYIFYYQKGIGTGEGFGYMFDATGVYRVAKKNTNRTFCLDKTTGGYVVLAGNSLYYTAAGTEGTVLKKLAIDGDEPVTILDYAITPACVSDSMLYFQNTVSDLHLKAINTETDQIRQVSGEDIYMPIVEGNTLYGIDIHDGYALIRMDMTTGEKTVLDSTRTDMLNVSDSYVYYQTSGSNPQFKRVSKDGSAMDVIADGAYNTINITSKYVYFLKFGSELPVYKIPTDGALAVSTFDAALDAAAANLKK